MPKDGLDQDGEWLDGYLVEQVLEVRVLSTEAAKKSSLVFAWCKEVEERGERI